jgi:PPM family protein phosphatase
MLRGVDELMSIGEFSERSGLSPKRLRSYAAVGLLVPAAVDSATGYRYYSPGQLRDARLVDALRVAEVPLADIAVLLHDPAGQRLDAWTRQVELDAAKRRNALELVRRTWASETMTSPPTDHEHERTDPMTKLNTAGRTDIGRVRDSNQDNIEASELLAAVADGMGGHPGGEVASAIAMSLVEGAFTGRSLDELQAAVRAANRAIWDRATTDDELQGMGTTICAAGLTDDGDLAVVNVGDSRAYLFRNDSLTRLTNDHSVTAEAVRRGEMSEQEALDHPRRSILTRALGVAPDVELDCTVYSVDPGDRVLVCSDGLFNEVPDNDIMSLVKETQDLAATADSLVELALTRGGRDNISVVIAHLGA